MGKVPVLGESITYIDTDQQTEATVYRTGFIIERPNTGVDYNVQPLWVSYFTPEGVKQVQAVHGSAQGDWLFKGEYGVR